MLLSTRNIKQIANKTTFLQTLNINQEMYLVIELYLKVKKMSLGGTNWKKEFQDTSSRKYILLLDKNQGVIDMQR